MLSLQEDISTLSINFTNQLMEICEITISKSKSGPKKKLRPPWWNQTCTNTIRTREKARKNTWVTRPKKIRISIINLRLMLEKCSKISQKNAGNHLSQNSHINQQVRKYWDMIHEFRGKPSVPITCLNLNDQIITDDSQKAETLAQHYDNMTKSYLPSCKNC